jgi:hypothetical protein
MLHAAKVLSLAAIQVMKDGRIIVGGKRGVEPQIARGIVRVSDPTECKTINQSVEAKFTLLN